MPYNKKNDRLGTLQPVPPTEDNRIVACDPAFLSEVSGMDMSAMNAQTDLENIKTEKIIQPGIFRTSSQIAPPKPYEGLELSLSVEGGKRVFFHGAE
ncbi:MAG: hypothetical protein II767_08535, partial [Proteobacteria bacterium]|nr:hypothetical protein [Pseudomonadota bacterium]